MFFRKPLTPPQICSVCLWSIGVTAFVGGQELSAQIVVSSPTTYTFRAWNGAGNLLVMTSDVSGQTGNNNSADASAVLTSVNGKPAVPAVDLAGQLGWQSGAFFNSSAGNYYADGASAVEITFTALADKKQNGTTASFIVLFDTTGDGTIGSNDSGLGLNTSFSVTSNTVTITQTSLVAFTLGSANGALAPTTFTVGSVTSLPAYTANLNGSPSGSGTVSDGNTYTVAMAALISDVSGTWHPALGSPTLTTAFTANALSGAGSFNLIDWYGTSASAAQTATLNIPEPATWAWSLGAMAPGLYLLHRRRSSIPSARNLNAERASPATPSGRADRRLSTGLRP